MFFLCDVRAPVAYFREFVRLNGISSLMEHIVLKEKLILGNMLNQVHNSPEMKLSSAYFRKMHHMWLGSCTRHSTSIALFAFKNHDDLRKASKYCHIGKKSCIELPVLLRVFSPTMVSVAILQTVTGKDRKRLF